ncbi:MAG TPA: M28 family metallopeptidase [Candidatus Thermoplasmatota archaeon]|nr:M28 family metallopeptidase [Candidatus Thermoplasmatota archaeon]
MATMIGRRNIILRVISVFIITCLVLVPSYTLAGTPNILPDKTPHKPAFVESKDDLVKVEVLPQLSLPHLLPPTTTSVNIIELIQQLNESLILGYLENLTSFGPRESGTEACDQAAHYLYETFQDMGLAVRYHNYTDSTVSGSNIEATLNGSDSTNIFIICGHYDSVPAGPGADDDGSGVAAVLAAAEIMRNYEFRHTVRFVCFSGEEQGLIGSRHYAKDAYDSNDSIVAVLNADMIGFAPSSSDGTKGKIFENTASEWIVTFTQDISQIYNEYIGIQLFSQGETWGSDHYYFWQYGYDAVFYHEFNFNDYYHSANDTIEHMNITYATRFSRLILATLAEFAQRPRPVIEITSISGGLGVTAQITNIGDENASDVHAMIVITGGFLGFINVSSDSESPILIPTDSMQLKASLFRVGKIRISVTAGASNTDPVAKHANGFLLGPFVLNVVNIP